MIKFYHILILGCILFPIIIINSNKANSKRVEDKINEEKSRLFNKIISGRYLEEEPEEKSKGTDDVCSRGSEELNNYYKTGNLDEIKLKEGSIECKDKDKAYMKALINILKSQFKGDGKDGDENSDDTNEHNVADTPDGHRNLNEEENDKISKEDIISYGKHLLPVLIFLAVALLCIPGWIICCFCCCCNCCCCCCCKKTSCKIPCFFITFALYAFVVVICFYGIFQSNHIFIGIADTECSILRFFDEILEGEIKTETPRWAGFVGINKILGELSNEINNMGTTTKGELDQEMDTIKIKKNTFLEFIQKIWERFLYDVEQAPPHNYYNPLYSNYYNNLGEGKEGEYVLDLIKMFGYYDSAQKKFLPEGSTLDLWEREYKVVSENADSNMEQAHSGFTELLDGNVDDITKSLDDSKDMVNDFKGNFNDLKGSLADTIVDNSRTIDEYGKMGFKAVFITLALIDVAIAVFILILCLCSGKCCTKCCCCCRCIFKLFTHILWNLLALFMIIVFLIGSLFTLVGKVGSDVMSIISYVVSEDNIGAGGDGIFIDQLGEGKKYITRCIIGDGKIEEELGLDLDQINSFKNISDAENQIKEAKREFKEKKDFVTYKIYKNKLKERVDLSDQELSLVNINDNRKVLNFRTILEEINHDIEGNDVLNSYNEKWNINSDNELDCDDAPPSHAETIIFNPKKCRPFNRDWIQNLFGDEVYIKNKAQIISDILDYVSYADKTGLTEYEENIYYKQALEDLKDEYEIYLDSYIYALDKFNATINRITSKLNEYTGGSGAFSFAKISIILRNFSSAINISLV